LDVSEISEALSNNQALSQNNLPATNMGFAASVAGRKNNQQFYKAKLQSGQDKQL